MPFSNEILATFITHERPLAGLNLAHFYVGSDMGAEIATFFEDLAAVKEGTPEATVKLSPVLELESDNGVVLVHIVVVALGVFKRSGAIDQEFIFALFFFK